MTGTKEPNTHSAEWPVTLGWEDRLGIVLGLELYRQKCKYLLSDAENTLEKTQETIDKVLRNSPEEERKLMQEAISALHSSK